jgi:hypothetical protein
MPFINYLFGLKTEISQLIFVSGFSGLLTSWFSTTQHLKRLRSNGIDEFDEKILRVKQVELIQKSFSTIALSELLRHDTKTQYWEQVVSDSTIRIKTKKSAQSAGEIITITVFKDQIKIESKPKLAIAFFESGKNIENIKTIKDIIEQSNT